MAKGQGATEASMVKAYVCKAAEWVTREAMQIHGGMGYAEEYAVSRLFVDARVLSIFEGADETLCLKVIARRPTRHGGSERFLRGVPAAGTRSAGKPGQLATAARVTVDARSLRPGGRRRGRGGSGGDRRRSPRRRPSSPSRRRRRAVRRRRCRSALGVGEDARLAMTPTTWLSTTHRTATPSPGPTWQTPDRRSTASI